MRQVLEAGNSGVVLRVRVRVSRDLLIGGSSVSHGVGLALRMQDEGGHRPSRQMIGHAVALGGTAVAGIHVAQDIKRQDRAVGLDGPVAVLGRVNENILVNILVDDVAVLIFARNTIRVQNWLLKGITVLVELLTMLGRLDDELVAIRIEPGDGVTRGIFLDEPAVFGGLGARWRS